MAFALAACSSNDVTAPIVPPPSPTDSVAGSFRLALVEDKALPVAILVETLYTLEVTAGTVQLDGNGQFTLAVTTRETVAGFPSVYEDTVRGTWAQQSSTVTVTPDVGSASYQVTWDGIRLTLWLEVATAMGKYAYTKSN